jgi:hypothetical protein
MCFSVLKDALRSSMKSRMVVSQIGLLWVDGWEIREPGGGRRGDGGTQGWGDTEMRRRGDGETGGKRRMEVQEAAW